MTNRRNFIKTLSCVSCLGLATVATMCKSFYYAPHTLNKNEKNIIISKTEFDTHSYIIVKNNELPADIYVCKLADNQYSALLMKCSHKGCDLNPVGDTLHCPCHGSDFTNRGEVLSPPADMPLHSFKVTTDNQQLIIHLGV